MQNKRGRAYYSLFRLFYLGYSPSVLQVDLLRAPDEILTHRVIWSFFFMVVLMAFAASGPI